MRKDKQLDLDFETYARLFLTKIPLAKKVNKHTFAGRCIVCGDSRISSRKTRLYLMRDRGPYPNIIVCHNCHLSTSAKVFFEQHCPDDMKELEKGLTERSIAAISSLKEEKLKEPAPQRKIREEDEYLISFEREVELAKTKVGLFFEKYTDPLFANKEATDYIQGRNIPDHFAISLRLLKPEYTDQKRFRYAYLRDYILIPFIDPKDQQSYYFHARRFRKFEYTMARYLACPYQPDDVQVDFYFNELGVTKELPIIICEGTISSMNLPNAISTNGIGKQTEEFINKIEWKFGGSSNIIYANDNELVDKDAMEKSQELLEQNKRVFLWSLMIKDFPFVNKIKDFNDLCVKANQLCIPLSIIEKYSTSSPMALLKAKTNGS